MQNIRDIPLIEHEIQRVMNQIKDLQLEEEDDQLLNRHVEVEDADYYTANPYGERVNYFKEFWKFYIFNELSIKKINQISQQNKSLNDYIDQVETLLSELKASLAYQQRKKNRRCSQEIERSFKCPYDSCNKLYGSEVSLNLHIKIKHQGGNKTEREKLAREIIQAQLQGEVVPHQNLKFPPGFLESVKHQMLMESRSQGNDTAENENRS